MLSHTRALGGTADDLLDDADLCELILPALRADHQAVGAYEWAADGQPPCSTTVLTGDQDPYATPFDVEAWRQQHSRDPFILEVLPAQATQQPFVGAVTGSELRAVGRRVRRRPSSAWRCLRVRGHG